MTYIQPGICVLIVLGLIGAMMRGPAGRRIGMAAAFGMFFWSWPPIAAVFSGTLERQYPISPTPADDAEAIVVLSSNVYPRDVSQPETLPGFGTYLRCRHAAWLYKHWKPLPILVSGGLVRGVPERITLAGVMKSMLEEQGIPPAAIWLEPRSESTFENAQDSAAILREKGIRKIVLVTEAYHMPRSVSTFRKQGLAVVPAPCAARSIRYESGWQKFLPNPHAIEANEDALHEWVGIGWYRLKGRL